MNQTEIIAVFGVIGTIVSPILALLYQKKIENSRYIKLSEDRKSKIDGNWVGKIYDIAYQKGEFSAETEVNIILKTNNRNIKGTGYFIGNYLKQKDLKIPIILDGGFKYNRFLVLNYSTPDRIQFGTLIVEMSASNTICKGNGVTYGAFSETIHTSKIFLEKVI